MPPDRAHQSRQGSLGGLLASWPNESLFRTHFENLPGPAYIWRRTGDDFVLVACNCAAEERVRTTAHEFHIGASAAQLQGNQLEFVRVLNQCLAQGNVEQLEIDYRYRSGLSRRLKVTLIPISPDYVVHHTEDITDRHRAEQALRASEARSRVLMAAHPDMLMRVTRDGVYIDAHIPEKIKSTLPFREEHFINHRVDDLFDAEFARAHRRYRERALETGMLQTWEYTRIINGDRRHIEARFVRSGEDEVLVTVTDVTARVDLEREIVSSVERERYHIGHDLHDGLGQLLTGVKLMLEPLRKKLPAGESVDGTNLQHVIDLINQAIAQTSELSRGLSPVPREAGMTLSLALEQLARRSESLFGITCRAICDPGISNLSEEASNNLYRIAQESITNAVKHGRATEVEVRCRLSDYGVAMTIDDNGVGFQGAKPSGGGMGLHIMRYRARTLGGEFSISCRPGGGMTVACSCPLPRQ